QHVRSDQPSRVGGGEVVLADVHAVGAGGDRHVDPIVDDHRHPGAGEQLLDLADLGEEPARAKEMWERFCERLRGTGLRVAEGRFGADMKVRLETAR
ncbi:MAG TPA: D-aminoacyl-tRNA deacylase, partial [Thermoanaerobaculales bacterium]|nr:D-aminoacyl-tRNA deacylase [Thermoanaerobaculales bacterium]